MSATPAPPLPASGDAAGAAAKARLAGLLGRRLRFTLSDDRVRPPASPLDGGGGAGDAATFIACCNACTCRQV